MKSKLLGKSPRVQGWRGRVLVYSGNDVAGEQILRASLEKEPDNAEFSRVIKNIKVLNKMKDEATTLFKAHNFD